MIRIIDLYVSAGKDWVYDEVGMFKIEDVDPDYGDALYDSMLLTTQDLISLRNKLNAMDLETLKQKYFDMEYKHYTKKDVDV